ncbi:MAG TPA: hypothetical protein VHG29_12630 [Novosphingobium sp.]|nr:hypothetical protein [Novosphingobium sp.]
MRTIRISDSFIENDLQKGFRVTVSVSFKAILLGAVTMSAFCTPAQAGEADVAPTIVVTGHHDGYEVEAIRSGYRDSPGSMRRSFSM